MPIARTAELFKECFVGWAEPMRSTDPDVVGIDAKTARRIHARRKGRGPLRLVSARASRQRLVLGPANRRQRNQRDRGDSRA